MGEREEEKDNGEGERDRGREEAKGPFTYDVRNFLEFLKQPPLHYHTHATCRFDLPLCTCPPSHAASLPFRLQALFAAHLSTFTAATAACWSVGAGSVLISQGIYTYAQLPVLPQLTVKIFLTH